MHLEARFFMKPAQAKEGRQTHEPFETRDNMTSGTTVHSLKRTIALATFACAAFLCGTAQASKKDDTVRFVSDQVLESVDPYFTDARLGMIVGAQVWDTLVYRDPISGDYSGLLATGWRRVDDRTLEFDLRQGVRFHNGEEFDAESVVYTLNYVSNPANKVTTQGNVSWIDHAEKVDKYKVRVVSKTVFPAALAYLAQAIPIYPAKYYALAGPRGMNEKPVGTGPYKVAQNIPGKGIRLERNDAYFAGGPKSKPRVRWVDIRFVPDRQTQFAEALAGGADLVMNVPKDLAEQARSAPQLQVLDGESMRIAFLQFNEIAGGPAPQFKDVRVRQAVSYAINRESIAKNIVGTGAHVANSMCFPSQFGCTDDGVPRYAYDPERARKLLAEAGFPHGFDTEILAYRERDQTEAIINDLAAVGIKAKLNFQQYAAMREAARANKSQIQHNTWGSFSIGDVSAITPVFFGFEADDTTHDEQVRDLLKKGGTSTDSAVRKAAYKSALALIAERAHALPLWSLPVYYVAAKDLVVKAYPDELVRFYEMSWK